ncbi:MULTISPECIES: 30S ribosomal protein S1 [Alistipes]|jgi:small subunit ribosomal protein S1|uniref:30S ribosomal protein S1 n=1 Tax=Alistipes TaxID=239759 RepID=UPI00203D39C9|nr:MULTISPECIES: 30S ribosomal protein S1 [Alistipes]MCX4281525.1 30S ribosomal protein S1 [Alistipes sp.]HUN14109.1 30S ribosomal protein S1 [Alistipes sp.]
MEANNNVVANENFDWNAFENDLGVYSQSKDEIAAAYDKTLSNVNVGEVVEGTVTGLSKREVIVNVGYKSEAIIPVSEFRYNPDLKVGDKIEVYVESAEDRNGQLALSHKKARQLKSWDRVNEALENDEIIKGYIKCRTKGGMIVDVFGIEAFLPGSQIDVKPIRDYDVYVDKTMEFKVVKINQEFRNVVVSHKALIEAELEAQKQVIMSKLEKGQILEGTVKNITSYGVFVDLGGVDGLIHITDLSWGRVSHPEEVVALDQKIQVVILDFDDAKKRIALGLKQLTPHPWEALDQNLKVGDKVKGKVVVMADYGAFVEIATGVEGLIHVSEMSWSQHLRSAQEFMKVGDEVEAVILTLDRDERKMSLGIKQLSADPWAEIETKYPVGTKTTAKVRNFTNFGVFVEIEEGIDGLIHISDLSWTKKVKHPGEFTQVGADIEVVVLEIDKDNRRLSLGHKQLEENPWAGIESKFPLDSVHEGTITEMTDKGAVVSLDENVEGFCPTRQLTKEDGSVPKVGDKIEFKILEFSKATKRITLSHLRTYDDVRKAEAAAEKAEKRAAADATKSTVKKINASVEKTTLGDIAGLAALKSAMEAAEAKKAPAKKSKKEETAEE